MKMNVAYVGAATLIAAGLLFAGCGENKPASKNDETVIRNLQLAWNAESNTAVKYDLYAAKAAEAGYRGVATLFRAASHSESILAANHAKILKSLGVEPVREIKLPSFTNVRAALEDALQNENYEAMAMYPEFIGDAETRKAPAAVIENYNFAGEAEKQHDQIYRLALSELENWKAPKTFFVCTGCGYTTREKPASCMLCGAGGEAVKIFE